MEIRVLIPPNSSGMLNLKPDKELATNSHPPYIPTNVIDYLLVNKLRENGVTIVDSIEVVDYGKFIHIMDPDGNKIELWEPVDSVLTKKGGPTTK